NVNISSVKTAAMAVASDAKTQAKIHREIAQATRPAAPSQTNKMAASRREKGQEQTGSKKNLEINTGSPLIKQLAELQKSDESFAAEVAAQIYDNAMIQAGLVVDPLAMVERNYKILNRAAGCL
ncbi:MAG: hypothetical protein N2A40_04310, partial [Desulfobulbaceae bacterium]